MQVSLTSSCKSQKTLIDNNRTYSIFIVYYLLRIDSMNVTQLSKPAQLLQVFMIKYYQSLTKIRQRSTIPQGATLSYNLYRPRFIGTNKQQDRYKQTARAREVTRKADFKNEAWRPAS